MEEEEAVGVVSLFDALKARVVVTPEGVLPVRFEVVGLPNVGSGARHELAQFTHRRGDGGAPRLLYVGFVSRPAAIGRRLAHRTDGHRGGVYEGGIDRGISRRGDERGDEARALIGFEGAGCHR
jgi:hypothetical protein